MAGALRRLGRCSSHSAFGFLVLGNAECAEGFSTETFAAWPSRPSIYWKLLRPRWRRRRRHPGQSERMGKEIRRRVLHEDRRIRLHLVVIPQSRQRLIGQEIRDLLIETSCTARTRCCVGGEKAIVYALRTSISNSPQDLPCAAQHHKDDRISARSGSRVETAAV